MLTRYSFPLTIFFNDIKYWKIRKNIFTQDFPLKQTEYKLNFV